MQNKLESLKNILLMGAGPSSVAPSTYYAMSRSTIGHLDPSFISLMDEIKEDLRYLMGTKNEVTVPLSGTGSAGMEASFVNMVVPGMKVLVLENGVFGNRMADVAERLGAVVNKVEWQWGTPVCVEDVKALLQKDKYDIVSVVHAETSTGVRNPVKEIGELVAETGAYYIVDTVTSLGGIPVEVDNWKADVCYSGSQKCLSCPPGLSPITFSNRAMEHILSREKKVPNWYLDMTLLTKYWGGSKRTYHHTAPINMLYALYQAIFNIMDEGVDNVYARHVAAHNTLVTELESFGMEFLVDKEYRLPELNAVIVPSDIDEAALRNILLNKYNIEVSSGLGPLSGKIIRIGLMGYNATPEKAKYVADTIKECMDEVKK